MGDLCGFSEHSQGRLGPLVIEVDEDVISDERQGFSRTTIGFHAR